MVDPSPLGGLLDRAGNVFSLAWQLGRTFQEERGTQGGVRQVDPTSWGRHQPAFNEFCAAVLDLRDAMQNPPEDFAPVAQALLKAAGVAKQIREAMKTADGQTWEEFLDYFPALNSVAAAGREAIQTVTKARRLDDPFAFIDQPAKGKESGIDTTPMLPRPPAGLIESAARGIPGILANVQPKHDGTIELVASHLAKRLQDAKHTLAAAQWAIHEGIQTGRLRAGLVEAEMPSFLPHGSGVWQGGERGTIAIPKGKPAPFDSFKVTATESLWAWWRSLGEAELPNAESPADANDFIERLLAGPDDVELTPREIALLEAHLRPPISFATTQREKKAPGHSPTEANRNKLKLIRDFNRAIQAKADGPESRSESGPAVGPTELPLAAKPSDDSSIALMRIFMNGLADDRIEKATRLLSDDQLTANDKLTKIDALIPFPATASAEQLGELVGVTKQAVLKTDWWIQNRKGEKENEIGRRRAGHQKRAKDYEPPGTNDDDE